MLCAAVVQFQLRRAILLTLPHSLAFLFTADGVDTIYTSASYSFTGDAPDCYLPESDDTISSPSTYGELGRNERRCGRAAEFRALCWERGVWRPLGHLTPN